MRRDYKLFLLVIAMAITSFGCLLSSYSFAFLAGKSNSDNTSIVTDNFNVTTSINVANNNFVLKPVDNNNALKIISNNIDNIINNFENVNNDLNSIAYGKISLSKNSVYRTYFTFKVGYEKGSTDSIPLENINLALFNEDELIAGPVSIGELPIDGVSVSTSDMNITDTKYILALDSFTEKEESSNYYIFAWLDINTSSSFYENENSKIDFDVNVQQETYISRTKYNISGFVKHNDEFLEDTNITLIQNNNLSTFSSMEDEKGFFEIDNIPEGTYTVSIEYNNNIYYQILSIKSDANVGVGGDVISCSSDSNENYFDNIQKMAYSRCLSLNQILRLNSDIINSNMNIPNDFVYNNLPNNNRIIGADVIGNAKIDSIIFNIDDYNNGYFSIIKNS